MSVRQGPRALVAALAVLAAGVTSGCSAGPQGSQTPVVRAESSSPAEGAPFALTQGDASGALASIQTAAGYSVDFRCPGRPGETADPVCRAGTDPALDWSAAVAWSGPPLDGGAGLTSSVVVNLIALTDTRAARGAYRAALARSADKVGTYTVPLHRTGDSYTPGEQGTGSRSARSFGGWSGAQVSTRYVLLFDDRTRSGRLATETVELQQGRYQLEVTWTAGAGDAPQLDLLTRRTVEALTRASGSARP